MPLSDDEMALVEQAAAVIGEPKYAMMREAIMDRTRRILGIRKPRRRKGDSQ